MELVSFIFLQVILYAGVEATECVNPGADPGIFDGGGGGGGGGGGVPDSKGYY